MRRFVVTAAIGLVAACSVGGCFDSAQQPPARIGSATQGPATTPSAEAGATPGSASNAGLSSSQLDAAITAAIAQATALHVTGTLTSVGDSLTLDARLNRNGTSSGTLGYRGASIPFVATSGVAYFQLTASSMALVKVTDPAAKGKWVTSTSGQGQPLMILFFPYLTLNSFLSHGMAGAGNTYVYVGLQQFGSQHVAAYQEKGSTGQTFDYDFPAVGAALPLTASGGDSSTGEDLVFTWNQPTTAAVPPASEIYTG